MNKYQNTSMFSKLKQNFLLLLACISIIGSVMFTFATGTPKEMTANHLSLPPSAPFENTISGIGFVEASSRNVNIGTFFPGIVSEVLVSEGNIVSKNTPLFIMDQQTALATVGKSRNALEVAKASLILAEVQLADQQDRKQRAEGLQSGRSISQEELRSRHFAVEKAKADIEIKKRMIEQAEADLALAEINLEKTIIKSPIDGLVLKVRITPGEYVSGIEQNSNSPMLLGRISPLYVRVQVDENDIWRFDKSLNAVAYLRSNSDVKIPLSFIRTEPYAKGKGNLRGAGTELIDTRIIEIIYKIDSDINNLFIGQQLDIFIESKNSP